MLTQQQKEHERNVQLLLQQCRGGGTHWNTAEEDILAKKEALLQEKSGLENKRLRSSQYLKSPFNTSLNEFVFMLLISVLNLNRRSQGSSERLPPVGRTEESGNAVLNLNGRSQGSSERLPPVGRTEESGNAGRGQHSRLERVLKSREEIRELVHAPLPPTWRRSSLPTENQSGMEELRQQMTSEPPGNRVLHPGMALAQWSGTPPLPHAKPRRESHRSSLSASLLLSNCGIIGVCRNPL
ncbi:UNVERIFIED_CONTAM: hypothetical protein FKN15_002222 [Acipenser sinensis]